MMRRVSRVLALGAAAVMVVVAASGERLASPHIQAVIQADRHFIAAKAAAAATATHAPHPTHKQATNKITSTIVGDLQQSMPYDYDTATQLFWHSVTAYCTDNPTLDDWSCASCQQFGPFTVTGVMDDTSNQGYVGYFTQGLPSSPIPGLVSASAPFVVVSFRGTVPSDLEDWIEDLSASKFGAFSTLYPAAEVHSGFWESYQAMKPGMMPALAQAISASGATTILFTGHSLGAAMAELSAVDIKLNNYPNMLIASYTQGTPRVGNPAFSDLFSNVIDASFREIHNRDVVAHLPPEIMGFQHSPMEIWFDEAFNSYNYCNSTMDGEDPNCSDSLYFPISISDHVNYRGIDIGHFCSSGSASSVPIPQANLVLSNATVPDSSDSSSSSSDPSDPNSPPYYVGVVETAVDAVKAAVRKNIPALKRTKAKAKATKTKPVTTRKPAVVPAVKAIKKTIRRAASKIKLGHL